MKLPLLLAVLALTSLAVLEAAPPALAIDQALKLAQEHLTGRGLAGEHFISSLTLEDSTVTGGEKYWFARWSPSIRLDDKSETGLRINLDGSLVRLTSGGRAATPARSAVGARSIR